MVDREGEVRALTVAIFAECGLCDAEIYEADDATGFRQERCRKCREEIANTRVSKPSPYRSRAAEEFHRFSREFALQKFGVPLRAREAADKYWLKDPTKLEDMLDGGVDKSYYIHGDCGTGKTVLASALLYRQARLLADGKGHARVVFHPDRFRFWNVPDLLYKIRTSYKRNDDTEEQLVESLKKAAALVLDDIGAEKTTDWSFNTLFLIVDARYQADLPTIFTSNHSPDRLSERMTDGRIASRISGWCEVRELDAKDLRENDR